MHTMSMRGIICGLSGCTTFFFFKLSHKRHDFRKKVAEYKMRVLNFCTPFVRNISLSKKYLVRYDRKCTVVVMQRTRHSCQVLLNVNFVDIFSKNTHQIS